VKERVNLKDLKIDGRIILKCILKKQYEVGRREPDVTGNSE
jgi:hypothetical protein